MKPHLEPSGESLHLGARRVDDLLGVNWDRVTGLPTLPVLFGELRAALGLRRQVGVIHIKPVNLRLIESLYGWQVFDRVMGLVAETSRRALGGPLPGSTLLALDRVAGDRLLAFVLEAADGTAVDAAGLRELADALVERLALALDGDEFRALHPALAFHAGHALVCQDPFLRFEHQVYAALDRSAAALERRELLRERSWDEELQRIIRESAIDSVLQPVVALGSGEVHGYEAFARGPGNGPLEAPRTLFALSGRLGIDVELDRLCFAAAIRASADSGHDRKLFVNVLPATGQTAAAGAGPRELLRSHGLDPAELVVELPERSAEVDPERFFAGVRGFRDAGFGIALDDAGAGFETPRLIDRVRPDFVKLDESLVRRVDRHRARQQVLSSIVASSARAGSAVIAKCVESAGEADALRRFGAEYAQGYWSAAPAAPYRDPPAPRRG